MPHGTQVQVGQRYVQAFEFGSGNQLWEVTSICTERGRVPHVRLVNVSSPSETKTLSCSALDGQHSFKPLNT